MKNAGDKEKKFGFVVSKKISKRAVDRNRIKRLLADAVKVNLEKVTEGTIGVFLPRKKMLGMKFEEVEKEAEKTLNSKI